MQRTREIREKEREVVDGYRYEEGTTGRGKGLGKERLR
jgi:hypothetical protein